MRLESTSSPEVGSSKIKTLLFPTKLIPKLSLRFIPPESYSTNLSE
jgi:hypothetical protein